MTPHQDVTKLWQ